MMMNTTGITMREIDELRKRCTQALEHARNCPGFPTCVTDHDAQVRRERMFVENALEQWWKQECRDG